MILDPSQEAAVELAVSSHFCVITGGPGTGKSTTLRVALDRMDARKESYALCAPTGKAAKRMSEATGRPATTIHRLLAWARGAFQYNEENPLEVDAVIVDESSMIDTELCDALALACGPDTRLVFVGDSCQLPSVGPGRVLADLVESNVVPVARLTQVHRAAAESWVCVNAPKILEGKPLDLSEKHDFRFVEAETPEEVAARVREIAANTAEWPSQQVLAPQRNTACGVDALNTALQQTLNPAAALKPEWKVGERILRLGDRVIQTRNNYEIETFNGEVGEVFEISSSALIVDFGDRRVSFTREHALSLELAYALTVHKSQGSEFAWAVCVVHSAHTFMLDRRLFYTAITRAKKGVILVGNRKGIDVATGAKDPPKRNTALIERMHELVATKANAEAEGDVLPW